VIIADLLFFFNTQNSYLPKNQFVVTPSVTTIIKMGSWVGYHTSPAKPSMI